MHLHLLPLALQPAVGFGLSNNTSPFFPVYHQLSPSSHSQHLEDLFPLLLSILPWVFLFVSTLPVLEWRSFWASYPPPFSPGDPANLSFVPLSILLYFLLYSTLLVLDSSYFSIPHLHIWDHIFFFPFKNKQSLFFLLRHRPCFRSTPYVTIGLVSVLYSQMHIF